MRSRQRVPLAATPWWRPWPASTVSRCEARPTGVPPPNVPTSPPPHCPALLAATPQPASWRIALEALLAAGPEAQPSLDAVLRVLGETGHPADIVDALPGSLDLERGLNTALAAGARLDEAEVSVHPSLRSRFPVPHLPSLQELLHAVRAAAR